MNLTIPASRRRFLQASALAGMAAAGLRGVPDLLAQATPSSGGLDHLVIDLAGTPESIDPALAYSARDWSVVHSIYDSIVEFGPDGAVRPLAAATITTDDSATFTVSLREGITFHDGSPVTAASIRRGVEYLTGSGSSASSLFAGITDVIEEADGLTVRIVCDQPSPWLPAQWAPWLVLLPEGFTQETAVNAPMGTGPYRFEGQEPGSSITLVRNEAYTWGSPKGVPLAERVTFRFVPEPATRIADLSTGAAHIITEIPHDQFGAVEEGDALPVEVPTVASAFIRIATDVAPFDRPEVRQALNHAVDVDAIASALVSPGARRLGSLFPDERSMAFNPDVEPYAFDPDRARQLLDTAGLSDGLDVDLELTSGGRQDVAEAIAAQLGDVGFRVTPRVMEYTEFNSTWADPSAAPLRMVTWGPLNDPHTLLSLVFASDGFLSRYRNEDVDRLIAAAAVEPDREARAATYREISTIMRDDPAAIYLWNLTSGYGVAPEATAWTPRGDDYVIAAVQAGQA